MLEIAKTAHEALGIQSTGVFVAAFAVVGALLFGGGAYLVDRTIKNRITQEAGNSTQLTRIEENVQRLLRESAPRYANPADREKALLERYPSGYILFLSDHANRVMPYESRANDFAIEGISLGPAPQGNGLHLVAEEIMDRRDGMGLKRTLIGLPMKEGFRAPLAHLGLVTVWVELLALRPEETAFVIGFVEKK